MRVNVDKRPAIERSGARRQRVYSAPNTARTEPNESMVAS